MFDVYEIEIFTMVLPRTTYDCHRYYRIILIITLDGVSHTRFEYCLVLTLGDPDIKTSDSLLTEIGAAERRKKYLVSSVCISARRCLFASASVILTCRKNYTF